MTALPHPTRGELQIRRRETRPCVRARRRAKPEKMDGIQCHWSYAEIVYFIFSIKKARTTYDIKMRAYANIFWVVVILSGEFNLAAEDGYLPK